MNTQRITPYLWFDTQARAAAQLYVSTFPDSTITDSLVLENTPSGSVEVLTVDIAGYRLRLMSAGPAFSITPAISFMVRCASRDEVDQTWQSLSQGGTALMELGEYPVNERFGWIQDRFGVSWQVMVADPAGQKVVPMLMFTGEQCGRTEEAIQRYSRLLDGSRSGELLRYGPDDAPDREGTVKFASFWLEQQEFAAMDSALTHEFTFTEAVSLELTCQDQDEIDRLWSQLSADPDAEQCGWIKDAYGVSWQITPKILEDMLADEDQEKVVRVTEAFLPMKKLVIADLERAYAGQ